MKQQELERENEILRKEIKILVTDPDSPEAHVIRCQVIFARELQKSHKTGEPLDIPKLLGLYGKMMSGGQKEKL